MTKPVATDLVKLYYRIGEVSQIVGVQPHVLRYWESEFRTIRPQKSSKGQRIYSRRDVEKLLRVKDLLKNQGFTIAGARRRLKDPPVASMPTANLEPPSPAAPTNPQPAPLSEPSQGALGGAEFSGAEPRNFDSADDPESSVENKEADAGGGPLASAYPDSEATARSSGPAPNGKNLRRALLSLRRELLELHRSLAQPAKK